MEAIKEVNLQELEEKYGRDLLEKIQEHIDCAEKFNHVFKISNLDEDEYFITIGFISSGYAYFYEVSKRRKCIVFENRIGYRVCKAISEIQEQL